MHLNESMAFVHIGMLKEVGRKFNRLIGVHILQKLLDQSGE
jgi:L-amino acid N-acyltransferase YncA